MSTSNRQMMLDALVLLLREHDQTYNGEPMSMEQFKALALAEKAVEAETGMPINEVLSK